MVEKYMYWLTAAILLVSIGGTTYIYEAGKNSDLCADNQIWLQQNNTALYFCPSENTYQFCSSLSGTKRTCYIMNLKGNFTNKEINDKDYLTISSKKEVIKDGQQTLIKGTIEQKDLSDYVIYDSKAYPFKDSISLKYDNGRFYWKTIDGIDCNFLWDNPTNVEYKNNIVDFKQGKLSDIKCNQNYSQIGDFIYLPNNWILDIDPQIIHNSSSDWTGPFVNTTITGNNVTLELCEGGGTYNGDGTCTLVFYPDAHPETSSVDGFAYQYYDVNEGVNWNTIVNAGGYSSDDSYSPSYLIRIVAGYTENTWEFLSRSMFLFNTSSLPNNANIVNATFSIHGQSKLDQKSNAPIINVYSAAPSSNTAISTTDFAKSKFGTTPFANNITYASYSTTGYNNFILNSAGIANITKTGITKFGIREVKYDVAGNTPIWGDPIGQEATTQMYCYYAEDTTRKPKLTVVYSATRVAGTYTSQVIDAGASVVWNNISWVNNSISGTNITFQVQSCANSSCGGVFVGPSNTSTSYFTSSPATLNTTLTPNNRYFQYKAFFKTGNTSVTPHLASVTLDYSSLNFNPVIINYSLTPTTAYRNSTLNSTWRCYDAENSTLLFNQTWYKSGVFNSTNVSQQNNNTLISYFYNGNLRHFQNWSSYACCNDGTANTCQWIGWVNISNYIPVLSQVVNQTAQAGKETNYTLTCSDIDTEDTLSYYNNVTGTSQSYYSLHSSSTGLFQFRPSVYEFINSPINFKTNCTDNYNWTSTFFQLNVTECTGGVTEDCDLGCIQIKSGCFATMENGCTLIS